MLDENMHDDPMSVSRLPQEEELRFSAPAPQIEGYQILEKLGEAGQGQVWQAVQLSTGRQVALKVPRIGLLSPKSTLARFEREVEIVAQLSHPHIARIIDSGVHRGLYYYAMDLIEGKHLDQYVRENDLSQRQILELMSTVCEAVQHAHQNGVIHRDLKPSNMLVTRDGHPFIVDFGLAKSLMESEATATVSLDGEAAGTPAYMAPEQAAGRRKQVDTRTDVYALGVILFRLITGTFPYDVSTSILDTLRNIQECDPIRPSKLVRHLDRDTEAIVLKALEKEQGQRYQSVAELNGDINCRLAGRPVLARSTSSLYLLRKIITRHRYTSAVAGLLVVIVLGFLGFSLQLSVRLEQSNRALRQQRESYAGQTAEFTRYAQMAILARFLNAWHRGDRQSAGSLGRAFAPGTREALAMRFLEDERPLDDKVAGFRQPLKKNEPCFLEFILAEHYLRDGQRLRAEAAYRVCLSDPSLEHEDPELAVWIGNRLYELTEGTANSEGHATREAREP